MLFRSSSPGIRQDKIDRFLLLIKKRQEVGVKITVITTDPEEITYGNSDVCHELIRTMRLCFNQMKLDI